MRSLEEIEEEEGFSERVAEALKREFGDDISSAVLLHNARNEKEREIAKRTASVICKAISEVFEEGGADLRNEVEQALYEKLHHFTHSDSDAMVEGDFGGNARGILDGLAQIKWEMIFYPLLETETADFVADDPTHPGPPPKVFPWRKKFQEEGWDPFCDVSLDPPVESKSAWYEIWEEIEELSRKRQADTEKKRPGRTFSAIR